MSLWMWQKRRDELRKRQEARNTQAGSQAIDESLKFTTGIDTNFSDSPITTACDTTSSSDGGCCGGCGE